MLIVLTIFRDAHEISLACIIEMDIMKMEWWCADEGVTQHKTRR